MRISETEFIEQLKAHISSKYGTQKAAADAWGVTTQMVSGVLNGSKPAPVWMADAIGYKRDKITRFEFVKV